MSALSLPTTMDTSEGDDFLNDEASEDLAAGVDFAPIQDDAGQHTFANTAFDAYFALNHKPSRTSNNVFTDISTPLTAQGFSSSISSSTQARSSQVPWLENSSRVKLFTRLLFELEQGFNLLFYGAGSKRNVLNNLAAHLYDMEHDVLAVNAFNPSFTIKDLLTSIENMPAMQDYLLSAGFSVDGQLKRVQKFLRSPDADFDLFLIIHNIDAPSLRSSKAKSCLADLASSPRIHLLASVDNIAFPTLWTLNDIFTRKSDRSATASAHGVPSPGYAWLFHDLTTLAPYDFETTYADRSSISGGSQASRPSRAQKDVPGASATVVMTEDAARHILLSVTQKAKKLFGLLGTKQLEAMGDLDAANIDPKQLAYDFSLLFNIARDDFVATNDTALRALMGEFKDHGLMVSLTQATTGAEAVWIPLRKEALTKVIADLSKDEGR
ncbi:origin recognition complex, subunit 2 [Cytidiella melzeri]|nr:origin recognition complex, subunit 2 [Cytidiella melzeri]